MKGIREAAMSTESETPSTTWPKAKTPSLFDKNFDSDRYDGSYYGSSYSGKTYTPPVEGLITISLSIPTSKIGNVADDTHPAYDWNKAQIKAEEIAYDRVEELLGKNYESKYSLGFDVTDSYDEYEVTITLSPIKK